MLSSPCRASRVISSSVKLERKVETYCRAPLKSMCEAVMVICGSGSVMMMSESVRVTFEASKCVKSIEPLSVTSSGTATLR